jgi:hypothetical protein
MIGDGTWTTRRGRVQLPRSHALWASGWGGGTWNGQGPRVVASGRSVELDLTHSPSVCGVGVASLTWHGPSSRSWTLRYVRTNHTNRVIINSSSCAPGPSVDHAVISLGPARLRRGTFRVVHGRRHGAVSVVVAFARTAAGLRPAGGKAGCNAWCR